MAITLVHARLFWVAQVSGLTATADFQSLARVMAFCCADQAVLRRAFGMFKRYPDSVIAQALTTKMFIHF